MTVLDSASERFEMPIRVQPADIDLLGHVSNIVYLRWVQEAAIAHWQARALVADQAKLVWVVTRHEIDYHAPALLDEELVASTWVGKATRLIFERHTEIVRPADKRLLIKALTFWCPVDSQSRKPIRVSSELRARFSVSDTKE